MKVICVLLFIMVAGATAQNVCPLEVVGVEPQFADMDTVEYLKVTWHNTSDKEIKGVSFVLYETDGLNDEWKSPFRYTWSGAVGADGQGSSVFEWWRNEAVRYRATPMRVRFGDGTFWENTEGAFCLATPKQLFPPLPQ